MNICWELNISLLTIFRLPSVILCFHCEETVLKQGRYTRILYLGLADQLLTIKETLEPRQSLHIAI